jgi:hypothetical protein
MIAIGLDVSKATFNAALDDERVEVFQNTREGIAGFIERLHDEGCVPDDTSIGVEATGIYHLHVVRGGAETSAYRVGSVDTGDPRLFDEKQPGQITGGGHNKRGHPRMVAAANLASLPPYPSVRFEAHPSVPAHEVYCRRAQTRSRMPKAPPEAARSVLDGVEHGGMLVGAGIQKHVLHAVRLTWIYLVRPQRSILASRPPDRKAGGRSRGQGWPAP